MYWYDYSACGVTTSSWTGNNSSYMALPVHVLIVRIVHVLIVTVHGTFTFSNNNSSNSSNSNTPVITVSCTVITRW